MDKRRAVRWAVFLVLLVPVVYLALQLVPLLFRGYETQTAVEATLADAVPARGVAVRTEYPLDYSGGVLGYLVEDGKRVAPGAAVGEIFTGEAQAQSSARAGRLSTELAMLEQSQSQGLAGGTDVDQILKQQQQGLFDLLEIIDSGSYEGLTRAKNAVTLAVNRLQAATGAAVDFSARIASLTQERDAALAAAGAVEYLYAPSPGGYFSSMTDGLEQVLTPEALDAMSASELSALAEAPGGEMTASAGKLIGSYEWYYYCLVEDAAADRFVDDGGPVEVEIDFDYTGAKQIPARVVSVDRDPAGGPAKIKLMCDYINAETVNLRAGTAQISFRRYAGVRIEQSAVHIVTDEDGVQRRGVFVKYGNVVQFKRIDPTFENDQYVIVPAKIQIGSDERSLKNEVLLYDEIITSGKDLYDGKLL